MESYLSNNKLSTLIGEIYDAAYTGDWINVLDQIRTATGSNKAYFLLQKLDDAQPMIIEGRSNFTMPEDVLLDYQSRPFEDPGYQVTRFLNEGDHTYVNEHINFEKIKDTDFYQNIFKPLRVYHSLIGILCRDAEYESFIVTNRSEDDEPYTKSDVDFIGLLNPHFSRAMHIFKELKLYRNYTNITKSVLDQTHKAILVCDESGQILIKNSYAEEKLVLPGLVYLSQNKLRISDKAFQQQLDFYINQCAKLAYTEINTHETLMIDDDYHGDILITVSPLTKTKGFNEIDAPCSLVTVALQNKLNWQQVKTEYSLTPKELQLLQAIYAKKKLNELTDIFHVSYNTLRTHLQSIFRKADVSSQTELLVKLSLFK